MMKLFRPDSFRPHLLLALGFLLVGIVLVNLVIFDKTASPAHFSTPDIRQEESLPGGSSSIPYPAIASLEIPSPELTDSAKSLFYAGKALAHQPWVKAPTATTARDGLGPLYNARSCLGCHVKGAKGIVPDDPNKPFTNGFVRLSIPGYDPVLGVIPEPTYGDQLQTESTSLANQLGLALTQTGDGEVKPEAKVFLQWQSYIQIYPDGSAVELRQPKIDIRDLGYGPFHDVTLFSLRNAPAIHGMGLIEAIPQSEIDALADPDDSNNDGISGRVNLVWSPYKDKLIPGRFGHKASKAEITTVVAAAFANDIGISNPIFPQQPCTSKQAACLNSITGNDDLGYEIPQDLLELVINFTRNISVPKQRSFPPKGRTAFYQSGCQQCHQPQFRTGKDQSFAHLNDQLIWPYSDFLLHDMGDQLTDGRPDFDASRNEWRTPPLWGLGLNKQINGALNLLHDGRARSVEEAILWHGGEATNARTKFMQLAAEERQQLVQFVEAL
ncbi:di-heme oxidoredictase family protein [Thalassolituus oleivorans]|uniref:di-heme oxidoreductase family protein n=1 Tax=Thalassolituus oleivorans TaxID=187493 RepID=UPI0030C7A28D